MQRHEFHPPHIYEANACYFITASTLRRRHYLDTEAKRLLVRDLLKAIVKLYSIRLYAWVILANHYHLLLQVGETAPIHRIIRHLHGWSAIQLNELDATPRRQVWFQYWDRFPRGEADFWSYFNYIHINPLKHGYVQLADVLLPVDGRWAEIVPGHSADVHQCLACYPGSSYHYYLRRYGEEFLTDAWVRYPIPDYVENDDP
jgi:putative transposase